MSKYLLIAALLVSVPAFAGSADLLGMYKGYEADSQAALTQPHRGVSELSDWISDSAADALQFAPGKAAAKLVSIKPNFTEAGYQSYMAFLNGMGLTFSLQNQSLKLTSLVTAAPVLIGQGASGGRYVWVYELPVIMTIGGQTAVNKEATIRIQIGRAASATNDAQVLIESWAEYKDPNAKPAEGAEESSGQN